MLRLETIKSLHVNDDELNNAFNKGYLDALLKDTSSFKLDLRLTIFIDDNCISCLKSDVIKKIKIDNQIENFVLQLDNDVILYCDRIDVMKWKEE